ncbi:UNVERIFIED_CONTAM: hypothetical protein FKN15_031599 [Acipenser sinensis]
MDAVQFAAMMDLLRQTLTAAVQGAARPAVNTRTLPHVVLEWDSLALPKQSSAPTNGEEMDAVQFAAMMDLLRQTLTAAVQGAARPAGPDPRSALLDWNSEQSGLALTTEEREEDKRPERK